MEDACQVSGGSERIEWRMPGVDAREQPWGLCVGGDGAADCMGQHCVSKVGGNLCDPTHFAPSSPAGLGGPFP